MASHAKVISGGKIVMPPDLRRELGIKEGDKLVIERADSGGLVIKTYAQVVRKGRAALHGKSVRDARYVRPARQRSSPPARTACAAGDWICTV